MKITKVKIGETFGGTYDPNATYPYNHTVNMLNNSGNVVAIYTSLKEGNKGHSLTDTDWWFCKFDGSEAVKQAETAENQRVEAENQRVETENQRVEAEKKREEYTDKIHATLGEAERLVALRKKEYEQEMEVRKVVEQEPKDPQYNIWFDAKTGTVKRTPVEDKLSRTTYRVYYMGVYTVKGKLGAFSHPYDYSGNDYITSLDLSQWDTSMMTDVFGMFWNWAALRSVNFDGWTMKSVRRASGMFENCTALRYIDVSSWQMTSLQNADYMFSCCTNLEILDVSSWDLSELIAGSYMFRNCWFLRELDTSKWNLSNIKSTNVMFQNCSRLRKLDFRNSTFRKVENANGMFYGVDSLQELWLPLTFDLLEELKINDSPKWGETEEGLKSLKWTFGEGADDRVARGLKPCVITLDRKVYDRLSDEERAAAAKKGWTIAKD